MIDLSSHPWMSGLFGDAEMAALFAPEAELQRYLQIEAAWTRALGQVAGTPDAAAQVAAAILAADIVPDDLKEGFAQDGVPIPALVRQLKATVGDGALVHTGMTSQDVMDTALVLALRDVLTLLAGRLGALDDELARMQDRLGSAQVMAITRMQPALETTAADVIARWRQPLARLGAACLSTAQAVAKIQWGGPIGTRYHPDATALGAAFAEALDLTEPGHAWHTDRTSIGDVGQILHRITTATGKIGEDIALMAALGPDQITLAGGSSSAMPHKNNPIKAEALVSLSDITASLQASLGRSARHEAFRSGRAWMLEWMTLPQMCLAAGASLRQADALIRSVDSIGVTD